MPESIRINGKLHPIRVDLRKHRTSSSFDLIERQKKVKWNHGGLFTWMKKSKLIVAIDEMKGSNRRVYLTRKSNKRDRIPVNVI